MNMVSRIRISFMHRFFYALHRMAGARLDDAHSKAREKSFKAIQTLMSQNMSKTIKAIEKIPDDE